MPIPKEKDCFQNQEGTRGKRRCSAKGALVEGKPLGGSPVNTTVQSALGKSKKIFHPSETRQFRRGEEENGKSRVTL